MSRLMKMLESKRMEDAKVRKLPKLETYSMYKTKITDISIINVP